MITITTIITVRTNKSAAGTTLFRHNYLFLVKTVCFYMIIAMFQVFMAVHADMAK